MSRSVSRLDIHVQFQSHRDDWTVSYVPPTALHGTRFSRSFDHELDARSYAYSLATEHGDTMFSFAYADGVIRIVHIPTFASAVEETF